MTKVLAPEDFQKLLEFSYLVCSDSSTKIGFFFQQDRRLSSTLILLDLIKHWGHPLTGARYGCSKKGRPANNLLLLEADSAWNMKHIVHNQIKFKSFDEWGSCATHVSDLATFRPAFFSKYSYDQYLLSYDKIEESIRDLEYWRQISR